jgi:hypothetical protein
MRRLCFLLLSLLAGQSLPAQPLASSTARPRSAPPAPADTTRVRQLQAQVNSLSPLSPQAMAVQQQALALA